MSNLGINVDLMGGGSGQGPVAAYMQKHGGINANQMRPFLNHKGIPCVTVFVGKTKDDLANKTMYKAVPTAKLGLAVNAATTLRPEEWVQLDQVLIDVKRERLTGYNYIVGKGLVTPLNNAYAKSVLEWHTVSDSQEILMTMDAINRSQGDAVQYKDHFLPLPLLHGDFEISDRKLAISRGGTGEAIDTTELAHKVRRIEERKEDLLFGSESIYSYGGGSIYSFFTFPDRNQVVTAAAWDASGKTGAQIYADVKGMKAANFAANCYGPFTLFIPTDWNEVLDNDYSVSGNSLMTIRQRLMLIDGIEAIVGVDRQKADNAVLVQMTKSIVDIVQGMPLQNVQWPTEGGMMHKFKTMTITVPRLRSDYDGQTGIAHLTVS